MALTSFNNSTVVAQTKFDFNKFTDLNSLYSLYGRERFSTYKGMIRLFNQKRIMNTPLLDMIAKNNAVTYVTGAEGSFMYNVPYNLDFPFIKEDMTGENPKPGIDGQPFKIKFSEQFNNTDLITYEHMYGQQVVVGSEEIYEEGDGWVHTVRLPQGGDRNKYFPKDKLRPGTKFFKITNVNGEYSTQKSGISRRTGMLTLKNDMAGHRSVEHWVTGYAHMAGVSLEGVETKGEHGEYCAYDVPKQFLDLNNPASTLFIGKDRGDGKPDPAKGVWLRRLEALLFAEINNMEENELWWSKGGVIEGLGRRTARVNLGLFEQLRNGNHYEFNKISLPLIESAVRKIYENSNIPVEQRQATFKCGYAALTEISKLLGDEFKANNPFMANIEAMKGVVYGKDAMNLGWGYRFTSHKFPMAGEVNFVWEPAFDNQYGGNDGGIVGDFPDASYTMAIFDVTDDANVKGGSKMLTDNRVAEGFNDSANIVKVMPKGFDGVQWSYEVGTINPYGSQQGFNSSSQRHGYGINMQSFSTVWLKDASRTVLMTKKPTVQ